MRPIGCALVLLVASGCGDELVPAEELGARLFADSRLSTSPINAFSCATCHPVTVVQPDHTDAGSQDHSGPIFPGYNLFDSVHRPTWWGGYETTLLGSINYCLTEFMGGGALDASDPRAREVFEYLFSVSPDAPSPAFPLTVVKNVTDLAALKPTADAGRGADLYERACRGCHGAPHSGEGKLGSKTSIIPEETISGPVCMPKPPAPPVADALACARAVVVEKIRHGKFFNIGGSMPLYSAETLVDGEIADLLAFLGL